MSNWVLKTSNLGKCYISFSSELKRILRWFGLPLRPSQTNWVLRHVNFEIYQGESIGIIGHNGAGKSTLLKLLTSTIAPTEGVIERNGRISAILELGMGFNPELTGRENARYSAGLMGFSASEINEAMDRIEEFAEIGDYFDKPVRTYSSGMQVRVAFAVATAWRPEVLIVDEALSVGDSYFQHKSFQRIKDFQKEGTTLLIVSHDRNAMQTLCDRILLLDKGVVIRDGNPEQVFDYYNALIAEKENQTIEVKQLEDDSVQTSSGTGQAKVESIALYNDKDEVVEYVGVGDSVYLKVCARIYEDLPILVFGYGIKDKFGQVMYGTNTWITEQLIHDVKEGQLIEFKIQFNVIFGVGSYSIQTALTNSDTHLDVNYQWLDFAMVFNVVNVDKRYFEGHCWHEPSIQISKGEL